MVIAALGASRHDRELNQHIAAGLNRRSEQMMVPDVEIGVDEPVICARVRWACALRRITKATQSYLNCMLQRLHETDRFHGAKVKGLYRLLGRICSRSIIK